MTTQEKIKAILDAIASKKATANQIEPSRKGATIAAIKRGKNVKPATVDKLYSSMLSILAGSKPSSHEVTDTQEKFTQTREATAKQEPAKQEPTKETASLSARVATLERENVELKRIVTDLISTVASLTQNQAQITNDNQVCDTNEILKDGDVIHENGIDFVIRLESQFITIALVDGTEKKIEYKRYYAKKKIDGKLHRVYLGDVARRNESMEKIKAYCKRHGLAK